MSTKLLKKIEIGNPLGHFGLDKELEEYYHIDNDQELAAFYHRMLDKCEDENRTVLKELIFTMISFSTSKSVNINILL